MNDIMKVRGNESVLQICYNILTSRLISIFCQRITVINVTFCNTADKLKSGKNIESQQKGRENENFKIVANLNKMCP